MPVVVTEQNPGGDNILILSLFPRADIATHLILLALGPTVPELSPAELGPLHLGTFEKTLFSMATPDVLSLLEKHNTKSVVLFGIEVRRYV